MPRSSSPCFHVWGPNDQWHSGGYLVIGRLSPNPHISQMPTVITPDHNHRIISNTRLLQSIEHQSNLRIYVADAGIIAMQESFAQFRSDRTFFGNAVSGAQLEGGMQSGGRPSNGTVRLIRQFDFLAIIKIPIFFRRNEIEM